MNSSRSGHSQTGPSAFPSTEWTMVLAAGGEPLAAQAALEKLCGKYWAPLFGFARRAGLDAASSEDAVQGFILYLLQRDGFSRVTVSGARFRSWLLTGFTNFLVNLNRNATAAKRGGTQPVLSLDVADAENLLPASLQLPPEEAYDQSWARLLLRNAVTRLRQEQTRAGKGELYAQLEPTVTGQETRPYASLSAATGIPERNLPVLVHRLRTRLREILRSEVAQTVATPEDLDGELDYLLGLAARS